MSKEFKPEVASLVTALTDKFSFDKTAGSVVVEKDAYTTTLPEGLTPEIVKHVSDHNTNFVAAGAKVFGDIALGAMAKDKKIDRLSLDIPLTGRDKVSFSFDRSVTSPNPAIPGESLTRYGVLRAKVDMVADNNAGQYKVARTQLKELAEAALGK